MHKPPDPDVDPVLLNQQSYDAIAGQWRQVRTTIGAIEQRYLEALVADMAGGDAVLDLGCGTGQPMAAWLINQGFQVTGMDQSANMITLAQAAHPHARWLLRSLPEFGLVEQFSAILLWDVLFHMPRNDHRTLLLRCRECLLRGGRLMLTSGGSADSAFTDTMYEHRFFYDSLAPPILQSLLEEIGFDTELMGVINPPTSGRDKGRIAIVARTTTTGI